MIVPMSAENFPAREGENSHSAKEMKTMKAQKDEGLKSTCDCKEVTRNGGIRERPRFKDGSHLHVFCQTRLCHIRSEQTCRPFKDAKSASRIAKYLLPRKDLFS